MACQPSRTFLLVASSTSKAGTICPAAMASIFNDPAVSFSRRSAKILKCSCSVMLAGQVDCIFSVRDAGACAWLSRLKPAANANTTATAIVRLPITTSQGWPKSYFDLPSMYPFVPGRTKETIMAKAYLITCYHSIKNPATLAAYAKIAGPAMQAAGGRFLVRGMPAKTYENGVNQRTVVVEFDSLERAIAAHDGPGYQEALRVLGNAAERDVRLVEGVG